MDEIELRKQIVDQLSDLRKQITKLKAKIDERFVRGYIMGCEVTSKVKLPSHWYDEIIDEVFK